MSEMAGSDDHTKDILEMDNIPTEDDNPTEALSSHDQTEEIQYYIVPASNGWVLLPAASLPSNISDLPAYNSNETDLPIDLNNQMIMLNSDNISEINNDSLININPDINSIEENETTTISKSTDDKFDNESTENEIRIYNSDNILNSALLSSNISFESTDNINDTEVQLNIISDNQMLVLNSDVLNCDLEMPLKYNISELSSTSINNESARIQLDLVSGTQILMLDSDTQLKEDSRLRPNFDMPSNMCHKNISAVGTFTRTQEKCPSSVVPKQKNLKKKRQTFNLNNSDNSTTNENIVPNYCEYCSQKFPTSASLRSHSKYIHTLNLVCKFCKLNHTELQDLLKHYNDLHNTSIYECNECEIKFSNESEFGKHLNNHVKDTPFPCKSNNCIERFKTLVDLKEHIKLHLLIACIKCGEKYKKEDIINAHGNYCNSCIQTPRLMNVPDRHYINPIPLQPYVDEDEDDLNLNIPTKTYKLFNCSYCNKKFNSEHLLQKHLINHEPNDKYICSKCGEKLRNQSELDIHFKGHIDKIIPISYPCNLCNKEFVIKRTLQLHLKTVHSSSRPFVCNICDKSFQRRCIYNVHMIRHNKTSPYECDYCKKAYKIKFELQEHIQKKHVMKQSYPCFKCNEIFKTNNELYIHYKTHKDPLSHTCEICSKVFKYKQGLKLHLDTHSNDRPYHCNYCVKTFKRKVYLRTHIASCHKIEYRFACNKCDMKFKTASSRYLHSKIHKDVTK